MWEDFRFQTIFKIAHTYILPHVKYFSCLVFSFNIMYMLLEIIIKDQSLIKSHCFTAMTLIDYSIFCACCFVFLYTPAINRAEIKITTLANKNGPILIHSYRKPAISEPPIKPRDFTVLYNPINT